MEPLETDVFVKNVRTDPFGVREEGRVSLITTIQMTVGLLDATKMLDLAQNNARMGLVKLIDEVVGSRAE